MKNSWNFVYIWHLSIWRKLFITKLKITNFTFEKKKSFKFSGFFVHIDTFPFDKNCSLQNWKLRILLSKKKSFKFRAFFVYIDTFPFDENCSLQNWKLRSLLSKKSHRKIRKTLVTFDTFPFDEMFYYKIENYEFNFRIKKS